MDPIKVMVVDDDKDLLVELKEILDDHEYEVSIFSSGDPALVWAREFPPDVIILDLKMDGKCGFQVARELKEKNHTARIPIIAVSAFYETEEPPPLMLAHGFREILTKPVAPGELLDKIQQVLENNADDFGGDAGHENLYQMFKRRFSFY